MIDNRQEPGEGNGGLRLGYDRGTLLTGGLLVAIAVVAWIGVFTPGIGMQGMSMVEPGMGMSMEVGSGLGLLTGVLAFLVAWGVMMTAMMLPGATPMIALYGAMYRNSSQTAQRGVSTTLFTLVYLALWLATGLLVYAASLVVDAATRANPAVAGLLPYAIALTLLAAGVFQFTPLKRVCLRVCQHPLIFLMGHWRSGYLGTLRMALEHAAYCIGCCWALMVVLVVAGAMDLHWMLLIAVVVFAEKLLPRGEWTARIVGCLLLLLGLLVAAQPALASVLHSW
jgi:predicted metal-binding membrane protein